LNGWGGQHSPLKIYHGDFFKGRETLRGFNMAFFSYEYERVKGRIIVEEHPHMQIHVGIFKKVEDQLLL
jgi:hypothetical protein